MKKLTFIIIMILVSGVSWGQSPSPTFTPSPTDTHTPTGTPIPTFTFTPTNTGTNTFTPTETVVGGATNTPTANVYAQTTPLSCTNGTPPSPDSMNSSCGVIGDATISELIDCSKTDIFSVTCETLCPRTEDEFYAIDISFPPDIDVYAVKIWYSTDETWGDATDEANKWNQIRSGRFIFSNVNTTNQVEHAFTTNDQFTVVTFEPPTAGDWNNVNKLSLFINDDFNEASDNKVQRVSIREIEVWGAYSAQITSTPTQLWQNTTTPLVSTFTPTSTYTPFPTKVPTFVNGAFLYGNEPPSVQRQHKLRSNDFGFIPRAIIGDEGGSRIYTILATLGTQVCELYTTSSGDFSGADSCVQKMAVSNNVNYGLNIDFRPTPNATKYAIHIDAHQMGGLYIKNSGDFGLGVTNSSFGETYLSSNKIYVIGYNDSFPAYNLINYSDGGSTLNGLKYDYIAGSGTYYSAYTGGNYQVDIFGNNDYTVNAYGGDVDIFAERVYVKRPTITPVAAGNAPFFHVIDDGNAASNANIFRVVSMENPPSSSIVNIASIVDDSTNVYDLLSVYRDLDGATPNLMFSLRGNGSGFCDGAWNGGGADYAEAIFAGEELDVGDAVVINGTFCYKSTDSVFDGVISESPASVGMGAVKPYLDDRFNPPEGLKIVYVGIVGILKVQTSNTPVVNQYVTLEGGILSCEAPPDINGQSWKAKDEALFNRKKVGRIIDVFDNNWCNILLKGQ